MKQRTLALLKPDVYLHRSTLVPAIQQRLTRDGGFRILRQKEISQWSAEEAARFYADHQGKFFYPRLCGFMTSGPFLAMELERENAIQEWRRWIGPTSPNRARSLEPSSLRALYGLTDTRNSFHGSDSPQNAQHEIQLFFGESP